MMTGDEQAVMQKQMIQTKSEKKKILLSMPEETYQVVSDRAEKLGISKNAFLNIAVSRACCEDE